MIKLTKAILKKTPAIGSTSELSSEEVTMQFKLFDCCGAWSWFIQELNVETGEAFGLVKGDFETELGSFNLNEIKEVLGWRLERDLSWEPRTLATLKKELKR